MANSFLSVTLLLIQVSWATSMLKNGKWVPKLADSLSHLGLSKIELRRVSGVV